MTVSTELFDTDQLAVLRAEMSKIDRIDPLSPTYRKMIGSTAASAGTGREDQVFEPACDQSHFK